MLNRTWIEARVPHKGAMCLLDAVDSHSEDEIVCCALSHRSPDNPLRDGSGQGIVAGIEYAAQAMAVHGVLREGGTVPSGGGYLVSARDVTWSVQRLDLLDGPLSGRATVILDAAGSDPSLAPTRS